MKVVLFCGGLGLRIREFGDQIPKPMVPVGDKPILLHIMRYYAHYGHHDFILCLGHQGEMIKQFFLNYNECLANDFQITNGRDRRLLTSEMDGWNITFLNTGVKSNIGQRLQAARSHLGDDEVFLANYADGLSDICLESLVKWFMKQDKIACFVSVRPPHSFHVATARADGSVQMIEDMRERGLRINGGFFIFRREIFDYMLPGEELVHEPFQRLIEAEQLITVNHDGFWACMDTFKEKQLLDEMFSSGNTPWAVWRQSQWEANRRPVLV